MKLTRQGEEGLTGYMLAQSWAFCIIFNGNFLNKAFKKSNIIGM